MEFEDGRFMGWAQDRYGALRGWTEAQLAQLGVEANPDLVLAGVGALSVLLLALFFRVRVFRRRKPTNQTPVTTDPRRPFRMTPAPGAAAAAARANITFGFVIAKFSGDRDGAAARIAAALAEAAPDVRIDRLNAPLSGPLADAEARARKELTRRRGAALVFGSAAEGVLRLRLVAAGGEVDDPAGRASAETVVLPWSGAPEEEAAAVAVLAAAGRAVEVARERYVEVVLAPVMARLAAQTDPPPLERTGLDRARLRQALGLIAMRIYEESGEADDLETAVRAADSAVCDGRRPSAPDEWAAAEALRGRALMAGAERDGDAGRMSAAAQAFRGALRIPDIERTELARARLQIYLAEALVAASQADPGLEGLAEACAALDPAVAAFDASGDAPAAVRARVARARALALAGRRAAGVQRLEEAAEAYRDALMASGRTELGPHFDWAGLQQEYADVLITLGERERGVARLGEAVAAYRLALEARSRTDAPRAWAESQRGLGAALGVMGEREKGAESLSEAVAALRAALLVYEDMQAASAAARVRRDLARAERVLAERRAASGNGSPR